LEKLNLKDGVDKDQFFRRLSATLDQLPSTVVQRKVLPLIASGLEFGSAPGAALSSLLHVARGLPPAQMSARVIPCILRLFASTDRAMRVALLQQLDVYVEHISNEQMESIYEPLATGFNDGTAFLRELTLKSLLQVVPKLSQRTLTSSLLKHLAKLQVDEEPAIRANTTICLGNIARYLGAAACKRVLLNAFTRALRDPFPPARAAGLMALQATLMHYDASEGALRVLPCVAPLTVDPDSSVRGPAFEAMDAFLGLLRKHHEARAGDAAGTDPAVANARPLVNSGDAPAAAASGSAGGGFLGWAVGGMGALAAAVGAPPAVTPEKPKPPPAAAKPAAAAAKPAASPRGPAAASPGGASGEGWGGGDDDSYGDVDQARGAQLGSAARRERKPLTQPRARRRRWQRARDWRGLPQRRWRPRPPHPPLATTGRATMTSRWRRAARPRLPASLARVAAGALAALTCARTQDLSAPPRPAPARAPPAAVPAATRAGAAVRPSAPALKPMKLGASKLGVSKLKGGDLDLEALLAD
jgi:SCY1-like protein 1